uniref:Uncharacterized protein n=1 Tax=Onchocerca volvulus TaxID=6282 RepID=A0A8R1XZ29_ONCVO
MRETFLLLLIDTFAAQNNVQTVKKNDNKKIVWKTSVSVTLFLMHRLKGHVASKQFKNLKPSNG